MQHLVLVGLSYREIQQVEAVVCLEVEVCLAEVEGEETCLCLSQRYLHLAHLHYLVRLVGVDTQCLSAVHDIFPESESHVHYALLGLLVVDGVVVYGACHARDVRVEPCVVCLPDHLLYYDRHLLLVYDIARGCHVSLGVFIVDRGID